MNSDISGATRPRPTTTIAKMPFLGRTLDRGPTKIFFLKEAVLPTPNCMWHFRENMKNSDWGNFAFPGHCFIVPTHFEYGVETPVCRKRALLSMIMMLMVMIMIMVTMLFTQRVCLNRQQISKIA